MKINYFNLFLVSFFLILGMLGMYYFVQSDLQSLGILIVGISSPTMVCAGLYCIPDIFDEEHE